MANKTNTAETTAVSTETAVDMEEIYREMGLSEAEIAKLMGKTGQDNIQSFDSVPVLKINTETDDDLEGNSVKFGRWVLGQVKKNDVVEKIGIDLSDEIEIVIYAAPQQYSRYVKDQNGRCNSNIFFNPSEEVVGSNFGFSCRKKGDCPHRAEGVDRELKCNVQFVVYGRVKHGEEWLPFISYSFKKSNYMPMANYMKSLGSLPVYAVTTKITKEKKKQGSVTYYECTLSKGSAVPAIELKENIKAALEVIDGISQFEKQRKQKQLAHKPEVVGKSPNNVTVVNDDNSDIKF